MKFFKSLTVKSFIKVKTEINDFDQKDMHNFYTQLLKMKKKRPSLNIDRIMKKLYGSKISFF